MPTDWKTGTGIPPELTSPRPDKWEKTKIKIPSPWNVNEWGGGSRVGIKFYMHGEDKTALTYMNLHQPTRTERPGPSRGFNSPVSRTAIFQQHVDGLRNNDLVTCQSIQKVKEVIVSNLQALKKKHHFLSIKV